MEKLRVGIVGVGGIANGKHMPALAKIPEVEMVAFCDLIKSEQRRCRRSTASLMQRSH